MGLERTITLSFSAVATNIRLGGGAYYIISRSLARSQKQQARQSQLVFKKGDTMKVLGINASPRKNANTQSLVEAVLDGAAEKGAETRMVHLRELTINGCLGCEGCKKQLGKCVQKDDMTTLLQEMTGYDAIVMGTPVY